MSDQGRLVAGRYRLAEPIGRGGMGTVWRAQDELLGRAVAVKKLRVPPQLPDDERERLYERTRREARSAARIAHPNVVVVHDVVEDEGLPCVVMEYVHSRTLSDVLKKDGPVTPREAARIGRGMVAALRAAHRAGVLHRDVKPGNVLLGLDESEEDGGLPGGRVVLTDFGIASASGTSTLTRTGELIGSFDYLAPERITGGNPGPASDLWALGATLYQAVEGTAPFHRDTPIETAYAIVSDAVEPPRRAGPLTPVIESLLAKEPERRMTAEQVERLLVSSVETVATRGLVPAADTGTDTRTSTGPRTGSAGRASGARSGTASRPAGPGSGPFALPLGAASAAASAGAPPAATPSPPAAPGSPAPPAPTPPDGGRRLPSWAARVDDPDAPEFLVDPGEDPCDDEDEQADDETYHPAAAPPRPRSTGTAGPGPGTGASAAGTSAAGAFAAGNSAAGNSAAGDTGAGRPAAVRTGAADPRTRYAGLAEGGSGGSGGTASGAGRAGASGAGRTGSGGTLPTVVAPAGGGTTARVAHPGPSTTPGRFGPGEPFDASGPTGGQPGEAGGGASGPSGSGSGGRRVTVVLLTLLVVLVVAVAGLAVWRAGLLPRRHAGGGGAPTPAATASDSPAPRPTAPAGFHLVSDPAGFSMAVPDGWTRSAKPKNGEVDYVAPDGLTGLKVSILDYAGPSPLAHWEQLQQVLKAQQSDYHLLRMNATTAVVGGISEPAAIWEWTWSGRVRTFHAIDLGFGQEGGSQYAIYLSTPDAQWLKRLPVFNAAVRTFRPGA